MLGHRAACASDGGCSIFSDGLKINEPDDDDDVMMRSIVIV